MASKKSRKTTETPVAEVSKEARAVAAELNKVMKLDPALDPDTSKDLTEEFREVCKELDAKDELSDATRDYLTGLQIKLPAKPAAEEAAPKGGRKGGAKAPKAKADKKPKGEKKPGVIAEILARLRKGPATKEQILEHLVKAFPDREAESMKGTINVQVPGRISREQGVKVTKDDKGRYTIK